MTLLKFWFIYPEKKTVTSIEFPMRPILNIIGVYVTEIKM